MASDACAVDTMQHLSTLRHFMADSFFRKMLGSMSESKDAKTWMCLICGWIYDEAAGAADHGIAAGTAWAHVPMNWTCPECGARKEDFEMVQI